MQSFPRNQPHEREETGEIAAAASAYRVREGRQPAYSPYCTFHKHAN